MTYFSFFFVCIALVGLLVLAYYFLLLRKKELGSDKKFPRQILLMLLAFIAFWVAVLFLPIEAGARGEISTILGVVFSALFALSSATLLANIMAGIVLRITQPFGIGDFIRVDEHFGRVSERGLFNTELQTEERAFVSIPNAYLIKHPLSARQASGTMVSVSLSLGYDLHHKHIEQLLKAAALKADLEKPFVHILELGDFSVSYRVSGLLKETKHYVSVKSRLFACVLDELHEHRIEILSPNYMAQRPVDAKEKVVPKAIPIGNMKNRNADDPVIFDKAEKAQNIEQLKNRCLNDIDALKAQRKNTKDVEEKNLLEEKIARKTDWLEQLEKLLAKA